MMPSHGTCPVCDKSYWFMDIERMWTCSDACQRKHDAEDKRKQKKSKGKNSSRSHHDRFPLSDSAKLALKESKCPCSQKMIFDAGRYRV